MLELLDLLVMLGWAEFWRIE